MRKPLPAWASSTLLVPGAVMLVAMFFAWIDVGPLSISGWTIAKMGDRWMYAVPAAGAVLAAAAATRSPYTRWAALAAGLVVAGDVIFELARGMLHMPWEGWMVIGGAAVILLGAPEPRRALRAIGGLAVIIGFFAGHGIDAADLAPTWIAVVLWAIAAAGAVAVASTAIRTRSGRVIALASGLSIYALLLGLMVYAAYEVFGIGAWAAFASSSVALAMSLLVPGEGGAPQLARDKNAK